MKNSSEIRRIVNNIQTETELLKVLEEYFEKQ